MIVSVASCSTRHDVATGRESLRPKVAANGDTRTLGRSIAGPERRGIQGGEGGVGRSRNLKNQWLEVSEGREWRVYNGE